MLVHDMLPLIDKLDNFYPPLNLFELFLDEPFCFFLDSAMDPFKLGRFSLIGGSPFLILKSRGNEISIIQDNCEEKLYGNPLDILGKYLEEYHIMQNQSLIPCCGGAVGYFSYDIARHIERLPSIAVDDLNLPECWFGFYDAMLVLDNLTKQTLIVSTGLPEQGEKKRLSKARERLSILINKCKGIKDSDQNYQYKTCGRSRVEIKSNFTPHAYCKAVEKARQYIINGDIFEVNLSQRFEAEVKIPPWELYKRLRNLNPAPFAAYIDCGEVTIVSASPERFLKLQGDYVETRPIKGTRRRGKTPEEDEANARDLLKSTKDHAENMMIVDLERNDLGRVCRYGTVKVTELAILEKFPTVFHLTSTITGRLREDKTRMDLLKATLPGGSITGAPKIRAMEIIDELEPTRRSIYTGNIGYLSFDGNMDLNIVIRTFLLKRNRAYFQAGGAVVYDSDPEAEYQETLDKARALMEALALD